MRKLLIFFTLFIFSAYSFTGDEVEKYVKEQHNKVFNYINSSEEILKNDRNRFLLGLEKNLKDLIISQENLREFWVKKTTKLHLKSKEKTLI